jgi:hypothetical protein
MKPIKKFSTEVNQPKSILESLDSKALDELIKGMGFNDIHELKREKNLLAKLEALLKEVNPKNDISEDDAEDIEDEIKKKGEPKSLEDKTGDKEPEVPVGDKPEEEEVAEEESDDEETEEESDEDETTDTDSTEGDDKAEVEVEVEVDDTTAEEKPKEEEEEEVEKEEESKATPKATRRIMTFEDFVQEETTTVNKNVSYRDDEEEEDNAVPVADSKDNEKEVEESKSIGSGVKSFSRFVSESYADKGPELKDQEASADSISLPIAAGDGSKTAAKISADTVKMGKPEEKKEEEGEELVTKDQEITEDPKTSKDEAKVQGKVVVKESLSDKDAYKIIDAGSKFSAEVGGHLLATQTFSNGNELVDYLLSDFIDQKDHAKFLKLVKNLVESVNEAEIKSDEEFKEYAFEILKNAFGDEFDETKAQEVVDGLISKYKSDYGAMVGALQSTMGQ